MQLPEISVEREPQIDSIAAATKHLCSSTTAPAIRRR